MRPYYLYGMAIFSHNRAASNNSRDELNILRLFAVLFYYVLLLGLYFYERESQMSTNYCPLRLVERFRYGFGGFLLLFIELLLRLVIVCIDELAETFSLWGLLLHSRDGEVRLLEQLETLNDTVAQTKLVGDGWLRKLHPPAYPWGVFLFGGEGTNSYFMAQECSGPDPHQGKGFFSIIV